MTREIKFRAWDKEKLVMLTGNNQYGEDEPDAIFRQSSAGAFTRLWESLARFAESERFLLMQSTNLFDKNGKEIFEGDIVSLIRLVTGENLEEVKYKDGCFYPFNGWDCGCCGDESWLSKKPSYEVIGNIYENPELLPPTKQHLLDNLTPAQEQKLQDEHAKTYTGTDDNMPDDFDRWLVDLSAEDISNLIK